MRRVLRFTKTVLKTFGFFVLTIFLILLVGFAAFFAVPEIEIKESRLRAMLERFAPEELSVSWKNANLKIVKTGYFSKDILIDTENICVQYKKEAIDVCFDRFFWGIGFSLSNFNPRISNFPPLIATGGKIAGDLNLLESEEETPKKDGGFDILEFARTTVLPNWKWNGSILEILSLNFKIDARRIFGAFLLETQGSWDQSELAKKADVISVAVTNKPQIDEPFLRLSALNAFSPGLGRANAQILLRLPRENEKRVWKLLAKADAQLMDKKRIQITSQNQINTWRDIDFRVRAILQNFDYVRDAQLNGKYSGDNAKGTISAKIGGFTSEVQTLDFVDCGFDLALKKKEADFRCGPQTVTLGLQERREFANKALFRLYPTFDLKIADFSYERGIAFNWDLRLLLQHLRFLNLDIDAFGAFASVEQTDTEESDLRYSADLEAKLNVADFKKFVSLVKRTPYAIPAPLNSMGGKINFFASGDIDQERGQIPFRFQTRLDSSIQKLYTTLGGEFSLQRNLQGKITPALRLDLALEDVLLSVPRIDVTKKLPQLLPDSRFKKGISRAENKKKKSDFALSARVATIAPNKLRLSTNLTGAPIPITLRYSIRPKRIEGAENIRPTTNEKFEESTIESQGRIQIGHTPIDLKNTDLKLLKKIQRTAVLEYFDIIVQPDGTQKINGQVVVKNPDAKIKIIFLGTFDQPVVRLESDPPAEQEQIMAALIFGKPLDQIDEDQAEAGAQAKTALNDTALAILQMLLLANTPIDSLNYDAESGRVVASVGIADGTSLEVGKGADDAGSEVGVRRRLAKNVYLNTYVEDTGTANEKLVNAFVEWVRRF